MRTRTTYVALLLALTAGTALTIVSCTPDATAPASVASTPDPTLTQAKVADLRQKYGWIGDYHTDGLAYIYAQLSKKDGRTPTRADMCRRAVKALKEFHKSTRFAEVPLSLMSESFQNEACFAESEVAPIRRSVFAYLPGLAQRSDLSIAAVTYLDRLGAVPNNANSTYDFMDQVNAIESEAAATLTESEASAVTAVASVARSSATYWEQNLDAWMSLPGALPMPYAQNVGEFDGRPLHSRLPSWWDHQTVRGFRKILGADIVSGARTAYLAWAAGPIGWEAVAASALFGSGTTAVALLLF
jgi:hypothetical protein